MTVEDTRVSAFDTWSIYAAIKLHFNEGTYDAFKFNFKGPRLKESTFAARRDRYFFEKLARRYVKRKIVIEFFTANVITDRLWIGDMSDEVYSLWQSRMQSLEYTFKTQMSELATYTHRQCITFDSLFVSNGDLPLLFKLYASDKLSLETLCVLDILCGYSTRINKNTSDPMGLLKNMSHKVNRYKPFIVDKINKQKAKEIVINAFTFS
jgi:hypothetical protein